jgi:hypothetical protein
MFFFAWEYSTRQMSMVCWFAMPDGLKLVVKDLRQFGLLVVGKYS